MVDPALEVVVADANPSPFARFCRGLVLLEPFWLLLLLPLALFPSPIRTPALLIVPLIWLARRAGHGRFIHRTPLNGSILLLLLMVLVSLYATFDIAFSLPKIAGIVYGVAVFYAVVMAAGRSARHLWWVVTALLLMGLGVAGVSLIGTRWSSKLPLIGELAGRLPARLLSLPGGSEGFNPNEVAGVLLWMTPLALALVPTMGVWLLRSAGERPRWQWALFGLAAVAVAGILSGVLLLTQSRAGLIGLATALAAMLWLATGRFRRGLFIVGLLLLAVGGVVVGTQPERVTALLFDSAGISLDGGGGTVNTLEGRQEIWSRAVYGIQDFPFTGMGMNTFRRVVHILYPLFLVSPDTDLGHAHNHLLQAALDLGIPGLIAYLAIWIGLGVMLWQVWQRPRLFGARTLVAGLGGGLIAYFVYGLVDAVALGARPGFLLWMLWGLVTALYQLNAAGAAATGRLVHLSQ